MLIRSGHFRLRSGLHSDTFIDASAHDFDDLMRIATTVAATYQHMNIQVVVGVPNGGNALAELIARNLKFPHQARFVTLSKLGGVPYLLERIAKTLSGQRVLVIEDVLTTGLSVKMTVEMLRKAGAHVVGVCTLYSRGTVTSVDLEVPFFTVLRQVNENQWEASECPLCPTPLEEC